MSRVRRRAARQQAPAAPIEVATFQGGHYRPLSDADCQRITQSALDILATVGIGEAPDWLFEKLAKRGAQRRADGRVLFPQPVVERALAEARQLITLPGFDRARELEIGGGRVHIGTGGAAVQALDARTGHYRDSTLLDLYRATRVLDQ